MLFEPPMPPETVVLSGTATGLIDPAHRMYIGVVPAEFATSSDVLGDGTFSLPVPKGVPFIIQGVEYTFSYTASGQGYEMSVHRLMQHSFDALDADTSGVVLDFDADELTLQTADVSIATPSRADSPVRDGYGACWVCPKRSTNCIGWSTLIDISADKNQFDASLVWAEPSWATDVELSCRVWEDTGAKRLDSYFTSPGYPVAGPAGTFADRPEWIAPAPGSGPQPLQVSMEWQPNDGDADTETSLVILDHDGLSILWYVNPPKKATTLAVPQLPSTADPATLLGTSTLPALLRVGEVDMDELAFTKLGLAEQLLLKP